MEEAEQKDPNPNGTGLMAQTQAKFREKKNGLTSQPRPN